MANGQDCYILYGDGRAPGDRPPLPSVHSASSVVKSEHGSSLCPEFPWVTLKVPGGGGLFHNS